MDYPHDIRPPCGGFTAGFVFASALFTVAIVAYAVAKWWPGAWE